MADNQSRLPAAWGAAEWEEMARRMCRTGGDGAIRFDYDPAIAEPFRLATGRPDVDMWPLFDALAEHPLLVVRGERSELFTDAALTAMAEVRYPFYACADVIVDVASGAHAEAVEGIVSALEAYWTEAAA